MTTNELDRVRALVEPIASDLELDLYDVERLSGTIRVTLDTEHLIVIGLGHLPFAPPVRLEKNGPAGERGRFHSVAGQADFFLSSSSTSSKSASTMSSSFDEVSSAASWA